MLDVGGSRFLRSKLALKVYRCLVVAGMITAIVLFITPQKQHQLQTMTIGTNISIFNSPTIDVYSGNQSSNAVDNKDSDVVDDDDSNVVDNDGSDLVNNKDSEVVDNDNSDLVDNKDSDVVDDDDSDVADDDDSDVADNDDSNVVDNDASNDDIPTSTTSTFSPSVEEVFTDYVVYNPSCKIPDYPKFSRDVLPYYEKLKKTPCSSKPLLTSVARSDINSAYTLNLHKHYMSHYVTDESKIVCCYSIIYTRNEKYTIEECQTFETKVKLTPAADLVGVTCKDSGNSTVYKINHFLVPIKGNARRKMEKLNQYDHRNDLSLMIIGLDAVSRLNWLRTMPKTVEYIERKGWYSFPAYHKIEGHTFDNVIGPLLTGNYGGKLKKFCWPDGSQHIDGCPYLWKNFSDHNYITAWAEDGDGAGCLKYHFKQWKKDGTYYVNEVFRKQPTDYYLGPHVNVSYATVQSEDDKPYCLGPIHETKYVLDFAADFASSFVNFPTFSIFWMNTGHDYLNGPQTIDTMFIDYLRKLESSGALNRTMILFLSDHGYSMGEYRDTRMGFVEHSLPFLNIWLPEWFRSKYPNKVENLARNKYRLVSHFDTHLTIMEVLGVKATAAGCPTCVSLFDPVPWNRGCADAGISGDVCVCAEYENIPVDELVIRMAQIVVDRINALAGEYKDDLQEGFKCSTLSLLRVNHARRRAINNDGDNQEYLIYFFTSPNDAEFEVFVISNNGELEVKWVTQLTQYKEHSNCMEAREGKQWCNCERVHEQPSHNKAIDD